MFHPGIMKIYLKNDFVLMIVSWASAIYSILLSLIVPDCNNRKGLMKSKDRIGISGVVCMASWALARNEY